MNQFDFGPMVKGPIVEVEPPVTAKKKHFVPVKPKGAMSHDTRQILKLAAEHGVEIADAYQLVKNKPIPKHALYDLKAKVGKYALTTPDMQKLAAKTVSNVLKGKPMAQTRTTIDKKTGLPVTYEEKIYPTHTNQIAAAAMVADRVDPIVRQNVNLNGDLKDFLPFNVIDCT